jgi:hypothetical protein
MDLKGLLAQVSDTVFRGYWVVYREMSAPEMLKLYTSTNPSSWRDGNAMIVVPTGFLGIS